MARSIRCRLRLALAWNLTLMPSQITPLSRGKRLTGSAGTVATRTGEPTARPRADCPDVMASGSLAPVQAGPRLARVAARQRAAQPVGRRLAALRVSRQPAA